MGNPEAVFTKSAQPATQGTCSVCGTTLYRMGATSEHEGLTPPEPVKRTRKSKSKKGKKAKASSNGAPQRRRGKLVIVESPAKARTIEGYLGKGYTVKGYYYD